jgi:Low-density lipoprotein receptor domain class A
MRNPSENKIHQEKLEKMNERSHRERFSDIDDPASVSHGVLIHQAPASNKPSSRNIGKGPIIYSPTGHDTVFGPRPSGTRRDDLWVHQGISPRENERIFVDHGDHFIMEEEALIGGEHDGGGSTDDCDVKCGPTEFFCPKSCSCIESSLHCDGVIDCGPDAEDEENCEITEDGVKRLKEECEANTLSRHVMCPNTLICIKEDWLCGEWWPNVSLFRAF